MSHILPAIGSLSPKINHGEKRQKQRKARVKGTNKKTENPVEKTKGTSV